MLQKSSLIRGFNIRGAIDEFVEKVIVEEWEKVLIKDDQILRGAWTKITDTLSAANQQRNELLKRALQENQQMADSARLRLESRLQGIGLPTYNDMVKYFTNELQALERFEAPAISPTLTVGVPSPSTGVFTDAQFQLGNAERSSDATQDRKRSRGASKSPEVSGF